MRILETVEAIRAARKELTGKLGFVPTMGALHRGHLELVKKSVELCDTTVVSIFVNPTQFGQGEDYEKYPRTLEDDLKLCEENGVDIVFVPKKTEIYPNEKLRIGFKISEELSGILCGASRPGHFEGVAQVVSILFNIVTPDVAIFGEKDYQQLAIIREMVATLNYGVEIVGIPTVREVSGLALSSRNRYLSIKEKEVASNILKVMDGVKLKADEARFDRRALPVEFIEKETASKLETLIPGSKVDYVEIRNTDDLTKGRFLARDSRIFVAIFVGETRLIDNLYIGA
jgi:pantoate--beta-alanine ligase